MGTKLESFVRVVESYLVRCLQSFRVDDSPVVLPTREYFASWRDETFSCHRVFGRAANKDVELLPVFFFVVSRFVS